MNRQTYIEDVRSIVQALPKDKLYGDGYEIHPAFKQLGYSEKEYEQLQYILRDWCSETCPELQRASQSLVKGHLRNKTVKMLAIERELTRRAITHHYPKNNTVTLYRGVSGSYARKLYRKLKKRQYVTVPLRGCDSWSESKNQAKDFGWLVIEHEFPLDWVVCCHLANPAFECYDEDEYVVAVPSKKIKVHQSKFHIDEDSWEFQSDLS